MGFFAGTEEKRGKLKVNPRNCVAEGPDSAVRRSGADGEKERRSRRTRHIYEELGYLLRKK